MSAETDAQVPVLPDPVMPSNNSNDLNKSSDAAQSTSPKASVGPGAKSSSFPKIPLDLQAYVSKTDQTVARLNKVLQSPGGLSSLLSMTNYSLYILTYLHLQAPTRAQVIVHLSKLLGRAAPKVAPGNLKPAAPTSPLQPLGALLSDTRASLRILGLIPMYVGLTNLLRSARTAKDPVKHGIALAQVVFYIIFQSLESSVQLTSKGVLSPEWIKTRITAGGPGKAMLYSCRAWLLAVICDFLRLFRDAQVTADARRQNRQQQASSSSSEKTVEIDATTKEQEQQEDAKWWGEFFVAASWLPMALHYSVPQGIGMNLGLVGLSGVCANAAAFSRLWASTKA